MTDHRPKGFPEPTYNRLNPQTVNGHAEPGPQHDTRRYDNVNLR
jgi:hypothetical protein